MLFRSNEAISLGLADKIMTYAEFEEYLKSISSATEIEAPFGRNHEDDEDDDDEEAGCGNKKKKMNLETLQQTPVANAQEQLTTGEIPLENLEETKEAMIKKTALENFNLMQAGIESITRQKLNSEQINYLKGQLAIVTGLTWQ